MGRPFAQEGTERVITKRKMFVRKQHLNQRDSVLLSELTILLNVWFFMKYVPPTTNVEVDKEFSDRGRPGYITRAVSI